MGSRGGIPRRGIQPSFYRGGGNKRARGGNNGFDRRKKTSEKFYSGVL